MSDAERDNALSRIEDLEGRCRELLMLSNRDTQRLEALELRTKGQKMTTEQDERARCEALSQELFLIPVPQRVEILLRERAAVRVRAEYETARRVLQSYRETEYGSPPTRGPWTPTTVLVCLGCYLLLLWAVEVLP